ALPEYQQRGVAQDDALATYAHKILKPEAQLDWQCSATTLGRRVKAFNPFPICYSVLGGERIRVWQAASTQTQSAAVPGTIVHVDDAGVTVSCGTGTLTLEVLQLEGGRALTAKELLLAHSTKFAVGRRFDAPDTGAA